MFRRTCRPVPGGHRATDSLAPQSRIEAIGLEPGGRRVRETADCREVGTDVAIARIEFMGDVTAGRIVLGDEGVEPLLGGIVLGDDGVEPLLGATALESAGIEVDPVNRRLERLPALRSKRPAPLRRPSPP